MTTQIAAALALPGAPVTVYSKPGCQPCNATYRALDKAGIDYHKVDITTAPDSAHLLDQFAQLGAAQAPIVVTPEGNHWSGFRPDLLKTLSASMVPPNPTPATSISHPSPTI